MKDERVEKLSLGFLHCCQIVPNTFVLRLEGLRKTENIPVGIHRYTFHHVSVCADCLRVSLLAFV